MSTLLLIFYSGVAAMILASLAGAVRSVSMRPIWATAGAANIGAPRLAVVETVDRRQNQLPFVGQDRRTANQGSGESQERRTAVAGG
ncbi:MAG: hypothetical protein ACKVQR_08730 [Aquabacterium sp.]